MSAIKTWSTTAASNNAAPPDGFPENMAPSAVNDGMREVMAQVKSWYDDAEWRDLGHTVAYASATTFTIAADVAAAYTTGRRIRCTDATTLYGTVVSSSYGAPNTTVTVSLDSGSLSASLSAVALDLWSANSARRWLDDTLRRVHDDAGGTNYALFDSGAGSLTFREQSTAAVGQSVTEIFDHGTVSGASALVVVAGKKSTSEHFVDLVLYTNAASTATTAASNALSADARTYSVSGTALRLAMGGSSDWGVRCLGVVLLPPTP
ncbi:MAG: hypothetical protein RIM84_26070 [Alphaproteobacteria bacterium]